MLWIVLIMMAVMTASHIHLYQEHRKLQQVNRALEDTIRQLKLRLRHEYRSPS